MALHWDITKCTNMEALQVEENGEWSITNGIIWLTLGVDMGEITKSNVAEFYARVKVWELVTGAIVSKYVTETDTREDYFLTFGDIQKRIGLSTNVLTEPITKWFKRIERVKAESKWAKQVSTNKIKAVYYSAIAEVEEYSASAKETVNA